MPPSDRSVRPSPPEPVLLTVDDVAKITGMNRSTVYKRHIHPGRLKTLKLGALRRIRRADFDAWLDEAAASGDSPRS